MTSGQKKFPVAPTIFKFRRHGQSGMEFSELLPHLSKQADKLAMIRTVHTEAINHDPAITFARPAINWPVDRASVRGSVMGWVAKTAICRRMLCSLPLVPAGRMISRLRSPLEFGFLPTRHQGVKFQNRRCGPVSFQPAGSRHRYPSAHTGSPELA